MLDVEREVDLLLCASPDNEGTPGLHCRRSPGYRRRIVATWITSDGHKPPSEEVTYEVLGRICKRCPDKDENSLSHVESNPFGDAYHIGCKGIEARRCPLTGSIIPMKEFKRRK